MPASVCLAQDVAMSSLADALGCCALLQFLFVERRGSSDKSNRFTLQSDPLEAITRRAADPRFPLFFIAPEATTKAQRCLLKFRRGAFSTGQPVVPVLLRYRYTHFNPGWGIAFTPLHVWRLMSQFVNHVSGKSWGWSISVNLGGGPYRHRCTVLVTQCV